MGTINGIDAIWLIITTDSDDPMIILKSFESLKISYVCADVSLKMMGKLNLLGSDQSFFITNWRDQHQIDKLIFDRLIDRKGRNKLAYFQLGKELLRFKVTLAEPSVRILKTLVLLDSEKKVFYYAMRYDPENGWQ